MYIREICQGLFIVLLGVIRLTAYGKVPENMNHLACCVLRKHQSQS